MTRGAREVSRLELRQPRTGSVTLPLRGYQIASTGGHAGQPRVQHHLTRWVNVCGLRPLTAAGCERNRLGEAADTPALTCGELRGVVNREYVI